MNQAQQIAQQALERARNKSAVVNRATLSTLVACSAAAITECKAEQPRRRARTYKQKPSAGAAAFAQYLEAVQSAPGVAEPANPLAEFEQALAAELRTFKRRR